METKIKFIGYVATSIDGRISKNSSASVNWTSKEDWDFLQKSLSNVDAVIVGYNTYKISEDRFKQRKTIVLTSKVSEPKIKGSIILINPKKCNLSQFLKAKNYKRVAILGGSYVYDFCLRRKMLDELFVTIEPLVFTSGVSMFNGKEFKKYKFSLQSIKRLNKNGTVLLKYKNEN